MDSNLVAQTSHRFYKRPILAQAHIAFDRLALVPWSSVLAIGPI